MENTMQKTIEVKNRRHRATRIMKCLRGFVAEFVGNCTVKIVFSVIYTSFSEEESTNQTSYVLRSEIPSIIQHIIKSTIQYLKHEISIRNVVQNPYYYQDCVRMIKQMILENEDEESPDKRLLNSLIQRQFDYQKQDVFTYFQVNGLVALCSKPDLCGFYSRGNSQDIIQLFDLIRPIVKQLNLSTYRAIYEMEDRYPIYKIFSMCANTPNTRIRASVVESNI